LNPGKIAPMKKLRIFVNDVMVIDTAAS